MLLNQLYKKPFHVIVVLAIIIVAQILTIYCYFNSVYEENLTLQSISSLPKQESMWHCEGWAGVKYPTEKSMKGAFK